MADEESHDLLALFVAEPGIESGPQLIEQIGIRALGLDRWWRERCPVALQGRPVGLDAGQVGIQLHIGE